jgi:hypothetical protein
MATAGRNRRALIIKQYTYGNEFGEKRDRKRLDMCIVVN